MRTFVHRPTGPWDHGFKSLPAIDSIVHFEFASGIGFSLEHGLTEPGKFSDEFNGELDKGLCASRKPYLRSSRIGNSTRPNIV
jgi:hypothetical protein